MEESFKTIPGFEKYCIDRNGVGKRIRDGKLLRKYIYGDRFYFDFDENSEKRMLAVHRAVALTWVENDEPTVKTVVNHIDGKPLNNAWTNLEWVTPSGNNYHAVNNNLRQDNLSCRIRNFYTKEVMEFSSVAQASEYMQLPKCTVIESLRSRKFGKLIAGQYEFRLKDDPEPWFYEDKPEVISPSRFMVTVEQQDGTKKYYFKYIELLKDYQLYNSPNGKSIPALVAYANKRYPGLKFTLRDGYTEEVYRVYRKGNKSQIMRINARNGEKEIEFSSMSKAAKYFGVDRSVIKNRMNNPNFEWCGWTFNGMPYVKRNFPVKSRGIAGNPLEPLCHCETKVKATA